MRREQGPTQTRRDGRLQYRLRTLLIAITFLAIVTGSFVTHRRHVSAAALQLIKRGAFLYDENGMLNGRVRPWGSIRDMFFSDVDELFFLTSSRRLRFSRNRPGANANLTDPTPDEIVRLTDTDWRNIGYLRSLVLLDLQATDVCDDDLDQLKRLTRLEVLTLGPNVTRIGVDHIQRLLPDCTIIY